MKKFIPVLIASLLFCYTAIAQSSGDYRSIGSGNWNDPTKWETYNGSTWISTTTYPGQNSGSGAVDISAYHEIKISASVPNPIASLLIQSFFDEYGTYEDYYGSLSFSAESTVSLTVSGNIDNSGLLNVTDQIGSKSHMLFIGGSLYGTLYGINGDDNLNVVFNSTVPNSTISGGTFQDVTFNGNIFSVSGMSISGRVTFINGIVESSEYNSPSESGPFHFRKGATWSGASNISYVEGWVSKGGDEPFTFPIGENGIYAPLTISAPIGATEIFAAKYKRESSSDLEGISDPGLYNVSKCEYWDIKPTNGNYVKSYPLDITVGWNSFSNCGTSPYITNVSNVTLAHFNRSTGNINWSTWDSHGGTATGTISNGSVTWRGVTTFSPFTLGNIGTCKTPSGITATNITGNSATITWSPEPGVVSYNVFYNKSPFGPTAGWQNGAIATTSTSVNLSGLDQATKYYYRISANCSSGSSSERQSEFTTLTVCEQPTGLITTNITNVSATFIWAPVPGATSYHVEYEYHSTWTPVNEVITTTSFTQGGLISGSYYRWRVRANCPLGSSHYQYSGHFWVPASYCGQPTWVTTTNITNNSATLEWGTVTYASNYNLEYKHSTSAIWISAATGITSLSYTLNGLSASTGYDWRVLATCFASVPGNYAQSSFTTLQTPPPPPPCNDVYETNNTSSQAKAISFGNTISAGITSINDVDWFKVTTPNNANTNLDVKLSNLIADYDLYVYNKSLKLIASSVTLGTSNEMVIYNSSARKATYYIKITGKNGVYDPSQCYSLLAQALSGGNKTTSQSSVPVNEVAVDPHKQLLYPNPASEFVQLSFNSTVDGQAGVQIFNVAGQLIKQPVIKINKGYNQVKVAVNDIKQGMYLLKINKGELNMVRRFVIAR